MGELWQLETDRATPKKVRRRTLRRWALPAVGGVLLVLSLAAVVGRGEEGRRVSQELDRLEERELILFDQLAGEEARVDSLGALPRMVEAAARIGLRRAGDGELYHLSDADDEGRSGVGLASDMADASR